MGKVVQFCIRSILIILVWLVVSEGDAASLRAGVPTAILAAAISMALSPGRLPTPSFLGAIRFAGFFLFHSVRGGVDVASRAIRPSLPIDPGIVSYRVRIEPTGVRVLFENTLSLLPGTLSIHLAEDELIVHVLDRSTSTVRDIDLVERRVAGVFGIALPPIAEESS